MTKQELQNALKAKGIAFNASDNVATLQSLLNSANGSDELQKKIADLGGFSFNNPKFQDLLRKQKEREFPDFGRDVPEGVYTFTGNGNIHQWTSPRTGSVSDIVTAYLSNDNGDLFEVATAAFAKREWDFLEGQGKNADGKYVYTKVNANPILPFQSSTAARNEAVSKIETGTKVVVKHSKRGHFDNPNNTRIWDFIYTYVEKS